MATMNISLPDELKTWVEEQAKGGGYATASDVMRDLVRRAIRREEAIARLNALIQEGIDSGIAEDYDPAAHRRQLLAEFERERADAVA